MNKKLLYRVQLAIGLILLSIPSCSFSATISELERSKDVALTAWIEHKQEGEEQKQKPFSVNEQVILYIEVSTPRWFTGGTRIGAIEVPNLIAKQRNQLATNFTERIGGVTWSKQRWEITLYPQASGQYVIPPIPVSVEVSAPDGSKVSGNLYTDALEFSARLPSGKITDETAWFAASDATLKQDWSASNKELRVGDAITRKVTLTAQDSLSVLLPDLISDESTNAYQSYSHPNRLSDAQSRGNYQSTRIEESVYVLQQGGDISFPPVDVYWWDSANNKLVTMTLEGKNYHVKHTFSSFLNAYLKWIVFVVVALVIAIGLAMYLRRHYQTHPKPQWWVLRQHIKAGEWNQIRLSLYKQLRMRTEQLELSRVSDSQSWQRDSESVQMGKEEVSTSLRLFKRLRNLGEKRSRIRLSKALPDLEKFKSNSKPR